MTDVVIRKFTTDVDQPVLAEPRRVSSSALWKRSGRRDAVKLTARLQNTLTYYQTNFGKKKNCAVGPSNGCPLYPESRHVQRTSQCPLSANSGQNAKRRPAEISPKPISADHAAAATSSLTPRVPNPRSRNHAAATLIVPSRLSTITGE